MNDSSDLVKTVGILPTSPFIRDCVNSWQKFGKSNLLDQFKKIPWEKSLEHLHDLAVHIIQGNGQNDYFSKMILEVKDAVKPLSLESDIADLFSILDYTVSEDEKDVQRLRFLNLLKDCQKYVSIDLWRERLKENTLLAIRCIPHAQNKEPSFSQRQVKMKTRLFYKQQKFNLLREENEGFAKLITELAQFGLSISNSNATLSLPSAQQCLQQVYNLIGYFDLDPNRVLAIILDVFDSLLDNSAQTNSNLIHGMTNLIRGYGSSNKDTADTLGHRYLLMRKHEAYQPNNIYILTAVLLREGIIDLAHIYPYLEPVDAALCQLQKEKIEKTKSKKPPSTIYLNSANSQSSLNNMPGSSATTSSSSRDVGCAVFSSTATKVSGQENDEYLSNQKIQLCTALLTINDWNNAHILLNRWPPSFATGYSSLAEALCRLLSRCTISYYREMCSMPACIQNKGQSSESNVDESLPSYLQAKSLHDLMLNLVLPMCSHLGANLYLDPVLMGQLCRIGSNYMEQKFKDSNNSSNVDAIYQFFFNLLDESILPSLVLCVGNSGMAEEVWELIKHFPYEFRYRLYGQWHNSLTTGINSKLWDAQAACEAQTKYILKRLTKENVKQLGRRLGKLAHSCPTIVFHHIQKTIQLYPNLTQPVVDSFKYLNSLSGDVLAYSVVENLATDKHKLDNFQLSSGFQALATFVALLAKKYHIDLTGTLQFVFNQMRNGVSYDLVVLREILYLMTGIEINVESTSQQVEAMCGGEQLRHEAGTFQQVRNTRKNSNRLRDTLLNENLALPLLYALAQRRESLLFETVGSETSSVTHIGLSPTEATLYWMAPAEQQSRRLKLAGIMYDECQETLMQFSTFLTLQMGLEELERLCPKVDELVTMYHVPIDVAFNLTRNIYQFRVKELFRTRCEALKEKENLESTKKLDMSVQMNIFQDVSKEVFIPIYEQVQSLYPDNMWTHLTPSFVAVFWALQTSDFEVPTAAYERQRRVYESQLKKLSFESSPNDPRFRREQERIKQLIEKLQTEEEQCSLHVKLMRGRLEAECGEWFKPRQSSSTSDLAFEFVWRIIPHRLVTSQLDAEYCAKFAQLLHTVKVPGFSLLIFVEKIMEDVSINIMRFTENESIHYGQFLYLILAKLDEWHSDEKKFTSDCYNYPGFSTLSKESSNQKVSATQQYERFRHCLHKWHYKLTKAFVTCIESQTFTQLRNSLLILTRLLPAYPRIIQFCNALARRTDKVIKTEPRKDLQALAQSYAAKLNQYKDKWVLEKDFHIVTDQPKQVAQRGPADLSTNSGETTRSVKRSASSTAQASAETAVIPQKKALTVSSSTTPTKSTSSLPSTTTAAAASSTATATSSNATTVASGTVSSSTSTSRAISATVKSAEGQLPSPQHPSQGKASSSIVSSKTVTRTGTVNSNSSQGVRRAGATTSSSTTTTVTNKDNASFQAVSGEAQPSVETSTKGSTSSRNATGSSSSSVSRTKSSYASKDAVKSSSGGAQPAVSSSSQINKRRGTDSDPSVDANVSSPEENNSDSQDAKERSNSGSRHGYSTYSKRTRHSGSSPNHSAEDKHHRRLPTPASGSVASSRSSTIMSRSVKK